MDLNKNKIKFGISSFFAVIFLFITIKYAMAASVNFGITNAIYTTAPFRSPLIVGEPIRYIITVSNTGAATGSSPVITDNFPAGLSNVSWSCAGTGGTGGSFCNGASANSSGTGNINITTAVIPSGKNVVITVNGRTNTAGILSDTATVTKNNNDTDTDTTNNSATASTASLNTQPSFGTCPAPGYYMRVSGGTLFSSINVGTGGRSFETNITANSLNAMAFNQLDGYNYLHFRNGSNYDIYRVGSDNSLIYVGTEDFSGVTNNPAALAGASAADIDRNGNMFMIPNANATVGRHLYTINYDITSPNFLKATSEVALSGITVNTPSTFNVADLAINPVDLDGFTPSPAADSKYVYATISSSPNTDDQGHIVRINPATGAATSIANSSISGLPADVFGGAFFGASGTLYVIDNADGQFYGITFNTARTAGVAQLIGSPSGPGSNTDGARCFDADDPVDIQIVKTADKTSVTTGQTVNFKLEVTNNGPPSSVAATITDNVPSNINVTSVTCTPSGTSTCGINSTSGNNVSYSTGFLTVGAANKITINVTGTALSSGGVSNTGITSLPTYYIDSIIANNTSSVTSTINLTKAFSPASISPSGTSTLDFTMNNSPGSFYTGIGFKDTLPVSPGNMVIAATPNIQTNCPAGGSTYTGLTSGTPDANGQTVTADAASGIINVSGFKFNTGVTTCDVKVDVTAPTSGTYTNNSSRISNNSNIDSTNVNASLLVGTSISGNIFEDINYGGGSGRSLATSSGIGRQNVRAELYNSSGNFVTFTTTDASGNYSFGGLAAGSYTVRTVNSTVKSSRTGTSTELGVQTFRTNGLTTNVGTADTNRVGGEKPSVADAANGSAGTTMNTATGAFTAGITGQAQSITTVTLGSSNITGIDFGYNFDTIVNSNDNGQGSLRQFILNSNVLSGADTSVFMMSDGSAHNGLRTGLTSQLTSGVAIIAPITSLPAISDNNTVIDGGTQTTNIGNTNNTIPLLGDITTVIGVGGTALTGLNGSEVEITGASSGLSVTGSSDQIARITLTKNGSATGSAITFTSSANSRVDQLVIGGTSASNFATPGNHFATGILIVNGADNLQINDSKIRATNTGITGGGSGSATTGIKIQRNEITTDRTGSAIALNAGIDVSTGANTSGMSTLLADKNYIYNFTYGFLGDSSSTTGNIISNSTIRNNSNSAISLTNGETNYTISTNILSNNGGAGILLEGATATGIKVIQNQYSINSFNSIDLKNTTGTYTPAGVTTNTGCTNAGYANSGLGRPIINSATLIGGTLTVKGSICATGSTYTIEVYKATAAGTANGTANNDYGTDSLAAGEGVTYLGSISSTGGNFTQTFSGIGLAIGDNITATVTNSTNGTSEFSANQAITLPTLSKVFSPASISTGQTSVLDFTINNVSGNPAYTGISFIDTLPVSPANMTVAAVPNIQTNCPSGGAFNNITSGVADGSGQTITASGGTVNIANMKLNSGISSCDVRVNVTATATGNYVNNSSRISGTSNIDATGVNATLAVTAASTVNISGKVFEDVNYNGGAGRSFAIASGVGRTGATVELYNSADTLVNITTTDSSGNYSFTGVTSGVYKVRVVNNTVKSSRTGSSSELGIQTFRTNASTGTAVAVTNHVGGESPELTDAGANTLGATLASLILGSNTVESVTTVQANADVTGVDFGFNFDTIVNVNDVGQGSLRQFINNSNVLNGADTSVFMIPNGLANPGQNTGYTNQLTSYAVGAAAKITLSGALPAVTDTSTVIDGISQSNNVKASGGGETNPGASGTGTVVGVSQTLLRKFDLPEVEIQGSNTNYAINLTGTNDVIKNLAFASATILLGSTSLFQDNLVGMHADGTDLTTATSSEPAGADYAVRISDNSNNVIVRHNYVKTNQSGIRRDTGGSNMLVEYNEVTSPTTEQTATYDGILLIGAGNNDLIQYNYIHDIRGSGSELGYTGAVVLNLVVQENTYYNNGKNKDGSASPESMNMDVRNISGGSVVKIYRNVITKAGGMGVLVDATKRVWITQNSIFNNGNIGGGVANLGIDLVDTDFDPNGFNPGQLGLIGVNPNDGIIGPTLANNGTDYPIVTLATVKDRTIRIKGYVGSAPGQTAFANSTLEFFKAYDDGNNNGQVISGDGKNVAHGEGREFIDTCNAAADGTFDCTFNNVVGVVPGDSITSTATNSNKDTSEFSNLTLVSEDSFSYNPDNAGNALPGATITYPHQISSTAAGNVTITSSGTQGWIYTYYKDVNGNSILDAGDTLYPGGANPNLGDIYTLNPTTHIQKILVKVQVPSNAPLNTVDTFNSTATFTPTSPSSPGASITVKDITTVSLSINSGALKLIKAVDKAKAKPGETVTYTINFTNTGSGVLQSVVINDVVPANTTFVSMSSSVPSTNTNDPATGKLSWAITGNIASGASGSVTFSVTIK